MSLLAVTFLGVTVSGYVLLGAAVAVIAGIVAWYAVSKRSK